MSNNLAVFQHSVGDELSLTAFVGPDGERASVQFTIGGKYATLSAPQMLVLIDMLQARMDFRPGYEATASHLNKMVLRDGTVKDQYD